MKKAGVARTWGARISHSTSSGRGDEGHEQGGCHAKEEGEDAEDIIGLALTDLSNNTDVLGEKG